MSFPAQNPLYAAMYDTAFWLTLTEEERARALAVTEPSNHSPFEPQVMVNRNGSSVMAPLDMDYLYARAVALPPADRGFFERDTVGPTGFTERQLVDFELTRRLAPRNSRWQHHERPGVYVVKDVARNCSTGEIFVVIQKEGSEDVWVRETQEFFGRHQTPTSNKRRFKLLSDFEPATASTGSISAALTRLQSTHAETIVNEHAEQTRKVLEAYFAMRGFKITLNEAMWTSRGTQQLLLWLVDSSDQDVQVGITLDPEDPNPGHTIVFLLDERLKVTETFCWIRNELQSLASCAVLGLNDLQVEDVAQGLREKFHERLNSVLDAVTVHLNTKQIVQAGVEELQLTLTMPVTNTNKLHMKSLAAVSDDHYIWYVSFPLVKKSVQE